MHHTLRTHTSAAAHLQKAAVAHTYYHQTAPEDTRPHQAVASQVNSATASYVGLVMATYFADANTSHTAQCSVVVPTRTVATVANWMAAAEARKAHLLQVHTANLNQGVKSHMESSNQDVAVHTVRHKMDGEVDSKADDDQAKAVGALSWPYWVGVNSVEAEAVLPERYLIFPTLLLLIRVYLLASSLLMVSSP